MRGAPAGTERTLRVLWEGDEPTAVQLERSVAVTDAGSRYLILAAKRCEKRWRLDTIKVTQDEHLDLLGDSVTWSWRLSWD